MKTVIMNVTRPVSPTESHVEGTTVNVADDLAEYYLSIGAARLVSVWMPIPSIFRLRLTGAGTITIDARDSLGNITEGVESYIVSGATDQIEFPYAGDNAVEIRAILTGTATAEVI